MIDVKEFYEILKSNSINCFLGVPDSLLKSFCAYITDSASSNSLICANEGAAIAQAAGHYLSTKNPALVYMQNSGLGNCVNPILSLMDEEVYKIPCLMLVGWRGEPDTKDEAQHIKQGKLTLKLLETLGIEYYVLDENWKKQLQKAIDYCKNEEKPFCLVAKKGIFDKYELKNKTKTTFTLTREEAIETILNKIPKNSFVVSTTGFASRELYELREKRNESHDRDFLTVGSMGHSSAIALGIALEKKDKEIYCFDGDGAALMHLGTYALIKSKSNEIKNFKHIVFNNYAHDSVGSQPTVSRFVDFKGFSDNYFCACDAKTLNEVLEKFVNLKASALLEIKIKCGARKNLSRPKESPKQTKELFMEALNK